MKFLFTTFEGGGHVPPAVLMASQLQARGHELLFISDEANRALATQSGLRFAPWRTAPNRQSGGQADDPLQDWRRHWPPAVVKAVCQAVMTGPSGTYADDTIHYINDFEPDLIVSNELLLGSILAAESRNLPCALLTANLWSYPGRVSLPPFGPGWPIARNRFEQHRQDAGHAMVGGWYDAGLSDLNQARRAHGLEPLAQTLDQIKPASPIILGTSRTFDLPHCDDGFVYAGPLFDTARPDRPSPLVDLSQRNVLLSFSTTYQDQAGLFARCLRALSAIDANVIVTTGPAVDPDSLPVCANARITRFAPHDEIVPWCDLVVSHGGHGTMLRPLRHGVPVLCLTMGRDHPDNAVRLEHHGAGLRLSQKASTHKIRAGAKRLLSHPQYKQAAARLGAAINATAPVERESALTALEQAAQRRRID